MYLRYIILVLGLLSAGCAFGQNLVPNNSFEDFYKQSMDDGLDCARLWYEPTPGSTDYFQMRSRRFAAPNRDMRGHTGDAFAGFYPWNDIDDREYISIKLAHPLRERYIYEFTGFVWFVADSSTRQPEDLHVRFTRQPLLDRTEADMVNMSPNLEIRVPKESGWTQIKGTYTAMGGERHVTLGAFGPGVGTGTGHIYYYVDDLSVVQVGKAEAPVRAARHLTVQKVAPEKRARVAEPEPIIESFELEHILFETGQDILLVESFKSLDDLVKKLKAMDDYHVEIQGHTDNTGALDTNLELSRKRAQAVVEYLVSKGVPRSKVQAKGFGSSAPKYDNDTEDGRRKNRRVECSITHRH